MTSHVDYIADQDVEQLTHLIEIATKRLDHLRLGGWVHLWTVADSVNRGWFSDENYADAVAFMMQLAQQHIHSGKRCELSIERTQHRNFEAQRFVAETNIELHRSYPMS